MENLNPAEWLLTGGTFTALAFLVASFIKFFGSSHSSATKTLQTYADHLTERYDLLEAKLDAERIECALQIEALQQRVAGLEREVRNGKKL